MRTKIVICDLCDQTTKEGEVFKDTHGPFIRGFNLDPRALSDDPGGSDKHLCLDCLKAIWSAKTA